MQIDNLLNEDMPVVFGAVKYFDKKIIKKSEINMKSTLEDFYYMAEDKHMKNTCKKKHIHQKKKQDDYQQLT